MRKVFLLLISFLMMVVLVLSGCAPGEVDLGDNGDDLGWLEGKLQDMQVDLADLEDNLDWVMGRLDGMQAVLEDLGENLEVGPPVVGDEKLVGVGMLGSETDEQWRDTLFIITNSDSEEDVTVDRLVITREDETLIYSGPYLIPTEGGMQPAVDQVLTPHEVWQLWLSHYKYDPDRERWIDPDRALSQDMDTYTVEVFWHAEDDTCPLAGWFKQKKTYVLYDYECVAYEWKWEEGWDSERWVCVDWDEFEGHHKAVTEAPMVNVRQVH